MNPAVLKFHPKKISFQEQKNNATLYLISVEKELKRLIEEYRPQPGDEELHFLFLEAIMKLEYLDWLIERLLFSRTENDLIIEGVISNER